MPKLSVCELFCDYAFGLMIVGSCGLCVMCCGSVRVAMCLCCVLMSCTCVLCVHVVVCVGGLFGGWSLQDLHAELSTRLDRLLDATKACGRCV